MVREKLEANFLLGEINRQARDFLHLEEKKLTSGEVKREQVEKKKT